MKAYSVDLRTRIVEAVDRQVGSQGEVAALFEVSRTLVKKLLRQRRETGSVGPKPHGGGHRRILWRGRMMPAWGRCRRI